MLILGCNETKEPSQQNPFRFTEVETSIEPTVCGELYPTQILEVNGTGLALFDFDIDGDLDLFIVNAASLEDFSSGPSCKLYANVSQDGKIQFEDVTETALIDIHAFGTGVAVGDVNGDGFDDLYITCYGPNQLLMNMGDGTFREGASDAGVADARWGTSASFGDLDGDGDLDLYVCNYLDYDPSKPPPKARYKSHEVLGGPHGLLPQADVVYENMGDGTFSDATLAWGFDVSPSFSLNVAILDFNDDGLQDVFVGNDSMANNLLINGGKGKKFKNEGLKRGISSNGDGSMQATMGIGIADVNGNSRPDLLTTNFSSDTNTLHINDESGFFDDRTKTFGLGLLSRSLLGWTCGFYDFDGDGDEDVFIVNGHVYPNATLESMDSEYSQPILLMERHGNRFRQQPVLQSEKYRDRAAVFGDLDLDGDIDVIVGERHGNVRVLQNDSSKQFPLKIHLQGNNLNPQGLGAAVHLQLDNGKILSRWKHDGAGFQSSMSTPILIHLPEGTTPISIEVVWATGVEQVFTEVPQSGEITLKQESQ